MTRPDDESHVGFESLGRAGDEVDLDARPNRDRFNQAIAAGRRRRRTKVALLTAATAAAVIAVGVAVVPTGSEPDRLVFTDRVVAPSTEPTVSPSTNVAPTSDPATPTPPSMPASSPPSTIPPATTPPGDSGSSIGSPTHEFITTSIDGRAVIDVRNPTGVVASFDLSCPPERGCTVQSTRLMGDTIWVAVTEAQSGSGDIIVRSRVMSVSRSSGEIVEHLALDGVAAVRSAGLGANGVLYAYLDELIPGDRKLVAIDEGQATVLETKVSGFRLSDDGRFLAVSFSDPPRGETARFEISDLVEQTTIGFDTPDVNAGPGAWSPDGRFLIVNEQWEDNTAWVIDPWSGSGAPIFGDHSDWTDLILDGACFMSNKVIAHRTWNVGYGQGDAQPGVVRLTSLDDWSTITELGDNLFGDEFRCHPDGSISYLRRPVIEVQLSPDFTQNEPDYDAPVELIRIATDGTVSIQAAGNLRMV